MGQKVHPLGFRLKTTQKPKSIWFTKLNNYSTLLKQDYIIRDYINKKYNSTGITNIEIERTYRLNKLSLKLFVAKPTIIITENGLGLRELNQQLKNILSGIDKIHIDIVEIKNPDNHATLLAQFIANQLLRRVSFKRAVRKAMDRAQTRGIKGIKVEVSGRLNGAEIARSEWVKKGRMPLQTLRADIDYATAIANTVYGIIGIKVWLFKGESFK